MDMNNLLTRNCIIADLNVKSKKQLFQELARLSAVKIGIDKGNIFDMLFERERLGTTGVGNGIAIPHAKLNDLTHMQVMFIRLEKPINFDAIDDKPVDLIFLLLAPMDASNQHLKALARISRLLRNKNICQKLRCANKEDGIYALLNDLSISNAA